MIIKNISILNYRNFRNFEIELKPFTLIIGENNIGKTNLLNAIGLVLSQEITFFKKRSLEIEDINYQAVRNFKEDVVSGKPLSDIRKVEVVVELTLSGFDADQEAVVADWFTDATLNFAKLTYVFSLHEDLTTWLAEKTEALSSLEISDGESNDEFIQRKIKAVDFPISKYSYRIFGGVDNTKSVDNYNLKMLKYEYLDALRDAKTQLVASGDYRLLYKILSNRGEGRYNEIKNILAGLDLALKENPELNTVKQEIKSYLDKTSLVEFEADNSVDFEFSKVEENEILKKLSLVYGGSPVTVERNGLGRNNLLYMSLVLSHLIGRYSPSTRFRLVAIEEPEAHLHPHLQEHLAKNIESEVDNNLQIIVTSHSTHITSKLSLEKTVIIFQSNGDIINHYVLSNFEDEKGKIRAEEKTTINYLKKYLDATKSTMFFAKRVILVEGIAEQLLIPKLFEIHANRTLEKVGISLVNVNGVSFRHFLKVIENGYFIKSLVITDSDSDTQKNERASDLKSEFEGKNQDIFRVSISSESTFEKDIIHSNSSGLFRNLILDAIVKTRPIKGAEYRAALGENEINVEEFFSLIVEHDAAGKKTADYKSDFAFNLHRCLQGDESEVDTEPVDCNFNIPQYIKDGFDFLYPQSV
jgi:putative ATP-dependent endonuclease of OLD family